MYLIFIATRIPKGISTLVEAISSSEKKFFFVRSKIDMDISNEISSHEPGSISREDVLVKVRNDCLKILGKRMRCNEKDIFLISSKDDEKGEFSGLVKAIRDVLPTKEKRESFILSLDILNRLSTETLKIIVEALEQRIWYVAAASAVAALPPIPGVSAAADIAMILKELKLYRSKLGLPDETSDTFKMLTDTTQAKVTIASSFVQLAAKSAGWLAPYATEAAAEEGARIFLPFIGSVIASALSFGTTYLALKDCLKTMEDAALAVLNEAAKEHLS